MNVGSVEFDVLLNWQQLEEDLATFGAEGVAIPLSAKPGKQFTKDIYKIQQDISTSPIKVPLQLNLTDKYKKNFDIISTYAQRRSVAVPVSVKLSSSIDQDFQSIENTLTKKTEDFNKKTKAIAPLSVGLSKNVDQNFGEIEKLVGKKTDSINKKISETKKQESAPMSLFQMGGTFIQKTQQNLMEDLSKFATTRIRTKVDEIRSRFVSMPQQNFLSQRTNEIFRNRQLMGFNQDSIRNNPLVRQAFLQQKLLKESTSKTLSSISQNPLLRSKIKEIESNPLIKNKIREIESDPLVKQAFLQQKILKESASKAFNDATSNISKNVNKLSMPAGPSTGFNAKQEALKYLAKGAINNSFTPLNKGVDNSIQNALGIGSDISNNGLKLLKEGSKTGSEIGSNGLKFLREGEKLKNEKFKEILKTSESFQEKGIKELQNLLKDPITVSASEVVGDEGLEPKDIEESFKKGIKQSSSVFADAFAKGIEKSETKSFSLIDTVRRTFVQMKENTITRFISGINIAEDKQNYFASSQNIGEKVGTITSAIQQSITRMVKLGRTIKKRNCIVWLFGRACKSSVKESQA